MLAVGEVSGQSAIHPLPLYRAHVSIRVAAM